MKISRIALATFCLSIGAPAHAVDIIIDNKHASLAQWSNFWSAETPTSAWPAGAGHNLRSTNATAWAQWAFGAIPVATYQVYVWWPSGVGGDPSASAEVEYAAGTQVVAINQSINGGQWNLIGSWRLNADSSIRISNGGSGKVLFDAVRLVPPALPPTMSFVQDPVVTARLAWDADNADSCLASGDWSGAKAVAGSLIVHNAFSKTYDLACTGAGGTISASQTVTAPGVEPPDDEPPPGTTQCSDEADNDGDGLIDLADPGCPNTQDNDEANVPPHQCQDNIDNDFDGFTDFDGNGGTPDPGCASATDDDETNLPPTQGPSYVGINPSGTSGGFDAQGKSFLIDLAPDSIRTGGGGNDHVEKVKWAEDHGIAVQLMLGYGSASVDNKAPKISCDVKTPAGRQCYANRSAAMAAFYGARIKYFEVWNEWNGGFGLGCQWNEPPCNDPVMYTDLLCKTYTAIKAAVPTAKVAGGSIAGADPIFLTGMLAAGAKACMNVLSVHLYVYRPKWPGHVDAGASATVGANRFFEVLNTRYNSVTAASPAGTRPIIITEMGFHPNGDLTPAGLQRAADYLTAVYSRRAAEAPFVEGMWWYELEDSNGDFGLIRKNNTVKPAYAAFKAAAAANN